MAKEPMIAFDAAKAITSAEAVLYHFRRHPKFSRILEEKNKRGGFVCVAQQGFGILTTTLIGEHPASKPSTFRVVGMKAQYLLDHPEHVMSRQGRDPERELWGGGFRIPRPKKGKDLGLIFAFSGFPEHADELFVMGWAVKMGLLDRSQVIQLLIDFPNDYAKPDDIGWI